MTRRYGRAIGKNRVVDDVPLNTPKNTTILSSVRVNGETVPTVFEGALNGERFLQYLREKLIPSLCEGDIVVMDNPRSHKVAGVKELITSAKAALAYLPVYCPDLNPIELMWSKIKAYLRKLKRRTVDELRSSVADAFLYVSKNDCIVWFAHVGYSC